MRITLPLFASLAAASVGSQSPQYVSPAAATAAFGTDLQSWFESNSELALQQVHDPETFSQQTAGVLNRLRLRPAFASSLAVDLEVTLAYAQTRALAASPLFANNLEPISTAIVVPRQTVQLPSQTNRSWTVSIPFARPFPFPGTLPITWQLRSTRQTPLASYLLEAWSAHGSHVANGTYRGCHSLHLVNAHAPAPGGRAYYYAEHYGPAATGPAALLLGTRPAAIDLAPFGAPGCMLQNLPDLVLPATQIRSLGFEVSFVVPPAAALAQATYCVQFALAGPRFNPLGIATSDGSVATIGAPLGIASISAPSAQAMSGLLAHNYGAAVGFD